MIVIAKAETVLGSIPAFSDTEESEGKQTGFKNERKQIVLDENAKQI